MYFFSLQLPYVASGEIDSSQKWSLQAPAREAPLQAGVHLTLINIFSAMHYLA